MTRRGQALRPLGGPGLFLGLALFMLFVGGAGAPVAQAATDPEGCLGCHAYGLTTTFNGQEVSLQIDPARYEASPHKDVGCSLCHTQNHGPLAGIQATAYAACANCHGDAGIGQPGTFVHPDPPLDCAGCHGPVHAIVPASDPASPLNPAGNVEFCGSCHRREADAYAYSYHGAAHTLGSTTAPVCATCHGHQPPVNVKTAGAAAGAGTMQATESSCESCHVGGQAALASLIASGTEHVTPLDRGAGVDGTARWVVWKAFLLIILLNVTKDGAVLALDLTRRFRRANGAGQPKGGEA